MTRETENVRNKKQTLTPKKRGPGRPPGSRTSKESLFRALTKVNKIIDILESYESTPETDLLILLMKDVVVDLEKEVN